MTTSLTTTTRGAWLARRARPLLAVYGLLLAVALLAPTSTVQSGMVSELVKVLDTFLPSSWLTYTRVEVLMNAVIIAPVSFLGSSVFTRLRWQDWVAYGFFASAMVELSQGILLPSREPSFSDIVANTGGSLLGYALAWVRLLSRVRISTMAERIKIPWRRPYRHMSDRKSSSSKETSA